MKRSEAGNRGFTAPGLLLSFSAIAVYIILLWFLLRPAAGQIFFSGPDEKGLLSALKYDRNNAAYNYLLGKFHHFNLYSPDMEKAIGRYRTSLGLIPLQPAVWIDLAKAYRLDGRSAEAESAFERAVALNPNNADLLWEAGIFWLVGERPEKAANSLKRYIQLLPEKQTVVYDLYFKMNPGNPRIYESLVPDEYGYRAGYLRYLMSTGRVEESEAAWKTIDLEQLERNLFSSYVTFLINNSRYETADAVWKEITSEIEGYTKDMPGSSVSNYSFENDILEGGFDWTVRETEGVNVFIDETVRMEGRRSLAVAFNGGSNPDILFARQVVRVRPGSKYSLRANIKTDGLTTSNGIFVFVQGHKCAGLNKRSETVTGTNFWKEISIDFEIPAGCGAVTVNFKRERSNKLDNRIDGIAWIDRVIMKQEAGQTSSSAML